MSCFDVKIVKSCYEVSSNVGEKDDKSLCGNIAAIESEHFLENVDEDVLFVDDSIEIKSKGFDKEQDNEVERQRDDELEVISQEASSQEARNNSAATSECLLSPLSAQIPLPIQDISSLLFDEIFMLSEEKVTSNLIPNPNEINDTGSVCVMAEQLEDQKILIFCAVQLLDNDVNVSQEVLSVVDENLKLKHEKIVERTFVAGKFIEKSLHILKSDDGFRLIKTVTKNDETEQWKSDVEWTQTGDFLSHGANVLLVRRLTTDKFEGNIETWTCDIDGDFILSKHRFHRPESTEISRKSFDVQRVDRLMIRDDRNSWKLSSFFIGGSLIKEISCNHRNFIHLNPFTELPLTKHVKNLHENWESDLQLISMFHDFKAKRKDELKQFTDIPRVKNLLRDFVTSIMKSKPEIVQLTVDFLRKLERSANDFQLNRTASRRHHQN